MKNSRVFVTGATGFIGRSLVRRLMDECNSVCILTRNPGRVPPEWKDKVTVLKGDLSDKRLSLPDGIEVVFHCAGEIKDETKMFSVHVTGTENLCAAAKHRIRHWVQLSSVGAYGPRSSGVIMEETPLRPAGIYETTKVESDQLVLDAARKGAFTFSLLRPSNIFGPAMTNRSLFQMIAMVDKGLFFFIGRPGASANYIHVDNVVEALIRCWKMPEAKGQIYNLSDYRTLEEFIAIIANELKRPFSRIRLPERPVRLITRLCGSLPGFPLTEKRVGALTLRSSYSIKKIQDELGYTHRVSMEDGLRQMVTQSKVKKAGLCVSAS
ncbi:MAG: NAD(P)-dependent oxidoreductase [Candidatus Omnitrophica bacterium]|nr:NAD(P)-dependent oxidoreductase [Candidatus Omnitrophota bacterium]